MTSASRGRRILSLWFPRLAVERVLRAEPQLVGQPVAVIAPRRGALVLASLSAAAESVGLQRGMALGDARAILPALVTRPADPLREPAFLSALRRWAGRFTPWVAEEGPAEGTGALVLDVTGCTHLFGGEAALVERVTAEAAALGLSLRLGLADTLGAAWALARFAEATVAEGHAGDAIDQEARATRSRARKRRWERDPPPEPAAGATTAAAGRIAPPGAAAAALAPLPVAALRLEPTDAAVLQGFGLRRVADVAALPRAQIAHRLGPAVMRRLDQALGRLPEPVQPAPARPVFALRLTFPEPVGREADVLDGIDRLLPPLCARLAAAGQGARRLRLTLIRTDGRAEARDVGLARPAARPAAIRPLLALRLGGLDAGFGIEVLRLQATRVEPLAARPPGPAAAFARRPAAAGEAAALACASPEAAAGQAAAGPAVANLDRPLAAWATTGRGAPLSRDIAPPSRAHREAAASGATGDAREAGFPETGSETAHDDTPPPDAAGQLPPRRGGSRSARQPRGPAPSVEDLAATDAVAGLLGRLGARLGLDALTRLHPADSHIPEKAAIVMAAAFSAPASSWPPPRAPRPVLIFPPELVTSQDAAIPPRQDAAIPPRRFVWRRRQHLCRAAFGPERIMPEWWLDDPAWRSGPRDYWRVETEDGTRLWLYRAPANAPDWFAQGLFA